MRSWLVLPVFISLLLAQSIPPQPQPIVVRSPDGRTTVSVRADDGLRWTVARNGVTVAGPSAASITIDGRRLGLGAIRSVVDSRADTTVRAVFYPRRQLVRDRYEQRAITLDDGLTLIVRVYDDAVAYRLRTQIPTQVRVDDEEVGLTFPGDPVLYAPLADCAKAADRGGADCFHTSFEEPYTVGPLNGLAQDRLAFLPVLIDEGADRPKLLVTEADLDDYPGLWLHARQDGRGLMGTFARFPIQEKVIGDEFPQAVVTRRANYIAETAGNREFPWRVLLIGDHDEDLPASDVVYRLGGDTAPGDWSWLRGGKSQSEWLWDNILYDVPFVSGLNTATYRYYLDFSARFGLGYLFFDAGWSKTTDPLSVTPGLDVPRLVAEARGKNLGVVLWTLALAMDQKLDAVLEQLQRWGATGVMVDFMDRDDQKTVQFYRRVVEAAAQRHLLVNFHGAYKPTGLERRFPNAVTREGVIASEYDKWSDVLTPEYEVTVPFIRGVVGPTDYEPGHMRNAQREVFKPMGALPMTQGTRMHQAAMYLVYDSPYAKMGGNVSDYVREPEFTRMLASIPTLWRDSRVLEARLADYIIVLREAADGAFWIGAMTDWTPRDLSIALDFLPDGTFTSELWQDGPNAARYGSDWACVTRTVTSRERLAVHLAPGGGFVARVTRSKPAIHLCCT
jgi:alpha-glucosidase